MEHEREEESGEMYSPNESGEYTLHSDCTELHCAGVEGCSHQSRVCMVTGPPHPAEEFIIQLEVTMADQPGRPCPPAYSWNGGMV